MAIKIKKLRTTDLNWQSSSQKRIKQHGHHLFVVCYESMLIVVMFSSNVFSTNVTEQRSTMMIQWKLCEWLLTSCIDTTHVEWVWHVNLSCLFPFFFYDNLKQTVENLSMIRTRINVELCRYIHNKIEHHKNKRYSRFSLKNMFVGLWRSHWMS
jgi:hypothetical protein